MVVRSIGNRGGWVVALVCVILIAWPDWAAARMFQPTAFTLENGLEVVVVEKHRAPIATQMVWYKVGAADETAGKSGLAHLLEHLMFKGTPSVPAGAFSKRVAQAGGRDNAFTSSDYTAYDETIAADRLDLAMALEADRMRNLAFDDKSFETERQVVLEERRTRLENNPTALLRERMTQALFVSHPYRRPVIGGADDLRKLTRDDALAFYRRWYAPNNAILIVAGDVTPDRVRALAEKYFGPIPRADIPARDRPKEPREAQPRLVTLRDARVERPALYRLFLVPSHRYGDDSIGDAKSSYAVEVLAEVLGGGATSRLYRTLVVEKGLAVQANVSYDPNAWDYATFEISLIPRPGVPLDRLQAALDAELARVVGDGVSPDEVERAKQRLRADVTYERDSLQAGARILGQALATGESVAEAESWPERIAAVTAPQVNIAAWTMLDSGATVTGLLLPASGSEEATAPRPSGGTAMPSREIR